jgi:hypothetical protein
MASLTPRVANREYTLTSSLDMFPTGREGIFTGSDNPDGDAAGGSVCTARVEGLLMPVKASGFNHAHKYRVIKLKAKASVIVQGKL